jgi:hypothetical protein
LKSQYFVTDYGVTTKIYLRFVTWDYEMVEKSCIVIGGCESGYDRTTAIPMKTSTIQGHFAGPKGPYEHVIFYLLCDTLRHLFCTSLPEVFRTQLPVRAFVLAVRRACV